MCLIFSRKISDKNTQSNTNHHRTYASMVTGERLAKELEAFVRVPVTRTTTFKLERVWFRRHGRDLLPRHRHGFNLTYSSNAIACHPLLQKLSDTYIVLYQIVRSGGCSVIFFIPIAECPILCSIARPRHIITQPLSYLIRPFPSDTKVMAHQWNCGYEFIRAYLQHYFYSLDSISNQSWSQKY